MSKKKKPEKRPVSSYVESAKRLAKFAPGLKKYKRRKTLNQWERAAITRKENALRFHTTTLIPVPKKLQKEFKDQLFIPRRFDKKTKRYVEGTTTQGIKAIELRGMSSNTKLYSLNKDMKITSNGRTWLLWKLNRDDVKTRRGMTKAVQAAFNKQFPIERVAELAKIAFDELNPREVRLWAPSGPVGDRFEDLKAFTGWLAENWNTDRYSAQEKWVNGIAILLRDDESHPYEPGEDIDEDYEE